MSNSLSAAADLGISIAAAFDSLALHRTSSSGWMPTMLILCNSAAALPYCTMYLEHAIYGNAFLLSHYWFEVVCTADIDCTRLDVSQANPASIDSLGGCLLRKSCTGSHALHQVAVSS
jgi:hypothetical protein